MQTAAPTSATTLLARFHAVRSATMRLIEPLTPEDMMVQSSSDASPVKWHLAHTSWFFETFVLREFLPGYQAFHLDFHWLFNSYYNSLGEMPEKKLRASFSRPSLESILAYRCHVDAAITRLLESPSVSVPHSSHSDDWDKSDEPLRRITLGLHHEQQHQELTATDIKHAFFTNPLHPAYIEPSAAKTSNSSEVMAPPIEWIPFEAGLTQIGIDPDPADPLAFAFDNETPRHTVYLAPFALASRPVTCAEYLAFVDDHGYTRPELWLSEGWITMREQAWQAPLYWQSDKATESGWSVYTLHGFQPLEALSETPVCHLSFFEADAYARWFSLRQPGCRLPTEFEWEHAASTLGLLPRGNDLITYTTPPSNQAKIAAMVNAGVVPARIANFLESGSLHPTPAANFQGLQQLFGDAWEWTSSGYTGYPGYKPLPGALGEYNGKFMSSQVILRGGSCVTPATHIRPTYRNFFPPSTRWQFSGLRLAK